MEGESWKGAFAACVAVVVVARLLGSSASAQQQPPVRTGVVAVPVDVRVVDSLGNPVTDLGLADFEIFEDGQRQTISHFGRWDLSSTSSVKRASDSSAAGEPYSRAFLIVLGRGRLEGPNKGLTAVESFVRSLHPTDRVAMLAYKRATDLTTDREPPLRFLRWFRERHHSLDVLLPKFPHDRARVEAQLAEAFKDPSLPGVREIPSPFAADNLSSLHFGIEYLRAVQGEKHLVFLSQEHLGVGSKRMMDGFAQRAADARVTVTVLNSGGTPLTIRQPSAASRGSAVTQSARSFRQAFAENDVVHLAEYTGGVVSLYEYHEAPLTRLLRATSAGYSLTYYPINGDWNGKLRRIEVRVNRPALTLHYRRGYRATDEPPPEEVRELLVESRIEAAGRLDRPLTDIPLTLSVDAAQAAATGAVDVEIVIPTRDIRFDEQGDRLTAQLHVAIYCGDERQNVTGKLRHLATLEFSTDSFARVVEDGIHIKLTVNTTGPVRHVKAIVYDPAADKLGSVVRSLR